MGIIVAKSAGFCFGVSRAVEKLDEEAELSPISTLGPIIHNDDVVQRLSRKGVNAINSLAELEKGKRLAIRTHGVGEETVQAIEQAGIKYVDLTCPFVKKIHKIVSEKHKEGYRILIVGDSNHPEVVGINGWCGNEAVIATDEAEL